MDDENGVHAHNGFYSYIQKNESVKLVGKYIKLKNILSEVTQVQIDKCFMFSLICGSQL